MVSENLSVFLSVCLSVTNFDPNYLRSGKTEWNKIHLYQNKINIGFSIA